jgi:hypothetical protein
LKATLWQHALVLAASEQYRDAYGTVLLHAATVVGPEQIASSAGWTPELTADQERTLVRCADPKKGLADFSAALSAAEGGEELVATWWRAFTGIGANSMNRTVTDES